MSGVRVSLSDSLFQFPNITDIVFPTAWVDEWPYLVATEVQAGWAVSNKVNFLASGRHNPTTYGAPEMR